MQDFYPGLWYADEQLTFWEIFDALDFSNSGKQPTRREQNKLEYGTSGSGIASSHCSF
jgi:hypothetical protein